MRKMLALTILVFAVASVVGPPACDSCVPDFRIPNFRVPDSWIPSGERVNPTPISAPDVVPATAEMVQRQNRGSFAKHQRRDEIDEDWQTPRRGDFWTPKDYNRAFPR